MMAVEIERKFLVINEDWRKSVERQIPMRQRYLPLQSEKHPSGRIRITSDKAFLTLKTRQTGLSRGEFEYELPLEEAEIIYREICDGAAIEKVRNIVSYGGFRWEIDEFSGDNAGLIVAEIELTSEDQPFPKPEWLGAEVTKDFRYTNSALAKKPYRNWAISEKP